MVHCCIFIKQIFEFKITLAGVNDVADELMYRHKRISDHFNDVEDQDQIASSDLIVIE